MIVCVCLREVKICVVSENRECMSEFWSDGVFV
jgi:hypothetical protein